LPTGTGISATARRPNERTLAVLLNRPRVRILWPDEQTTHHYARLFLQLRKQGTPIPTNDIWIAALAVQHDLVLFSRDAPLRAAAAAAPGMIEDTDAFHYSARS
jgi:predicted nucleic acid-binding protein